MSEETPVPSIPLARPDPRLIQELFDKDPLELSEQDLDLIIAEFRADRVSYLQAEVTKGKARKAKSDLPSVTYLTIGFPVILDEQIIHCRVEVYSARQELGSASVIIGGVGHLIVPTDEMVAEFAARGCVDIFA